MSEERFTTDVRVTCGEVTEEKSFFKVKGGMSTDEAGALAKMVLDETGQELSEDCVYCFIGGENEELEEFIENLKAIGEEATKGEVQLKQFKIEKGTWVELNVKQLFQSGPGKEGMEHLHKLCQDIEGKAFWDMSAVSSKTGADMIEYRKWSANKFGSYTYSSPFFAFRQDSRFSM